MNIEPFYLVWNYNGGTPTVRHESREAAEREATRLAMLNKGQHFIVLSSLVDVVIAEPVTKTSIVPFNELPF